MSIVQDGQSTSLAAQGSAQGSVENEKTQEPPSATTVTEQQLPSEDYKPVVFQLEQLDSYSATDPVTKEV